MAPAAHVGAPARVLVEFGASSTWQLVHALLSKLLIATACGLSAWQLGTYLLIARARLFYPYPLEWMEGGALEHVARILEHKPLYVAPSLEFAPFIYTPLYYWVCAPFVQLMGLQLSSLRLVSLLSSALVFVLLFGIVFSRTRNAIAGFIAAGIYASCFEVCSGWFDLARVDSLSLCFLLFATWLLVRGSRHDIWIGSIFALAFLTKQSTLIVAAPLLAARFISQQGVRRVHAPLAFCAIVLASTLLQNWLSHGYYKYYVFDLPSQHTWIKSMRREFWRWDLFTNVPFACAAALYVLTTASGWRSQLTLWSAAIGYCALSYISRMHVGGAANVLMPSMAFFAWSMGEALHFLSQPLRPSELPKPSALQAPVTPQNPAPPHALWQRSLRSSSSLFGLTLCIAQLSWLLYTPAHHLPDEVDRKSQRALVEYLRTVPGPILAPGDPLLARLIGNTGSVHQQALTDISLGTEPRRQQALERRIHAKLAQQYYAAIVINGEWHSADLKAHYVLAPTHVVPTTATLEGAPSRATEVWLRRTPEVVKP